MSKKAIQTKYERLEADYESLGNVRYEVFDFEPFFYRPSAISEDIFADWKRNTEIEEPILFSPINKRSLGTFRRGVYNWQIACLLANYPEVQINTETGRVYSVLEQAFMRGEAKAINYITNDVGLLDENIRLDPKKDWEGLCKYFFKEMPIRIDGVELQGVNSIKTFVPKTGSIDTIYWIGYFTEILMQLEDTGDRFFTSKDRTVKKRCEVPKFTDIIEGEAARIEKTLREMYFVGGQTQKPVFWSTFLSVAYSKGILRHYSLRDYANIINTSFDQDISEQNLQNFSKFRKGEWEPPTSFDFSFL